MTFFLRVKEELTTYLWPMKPTDYTDAQIMAAIVEAREEQPKYLRLDEHKYFWSVAAILIPQHPTYVKLSAQDYAEMDAYTKKQYYKYWRKYWHQAKIFAEFYATVDAYDQWTDWREYTSRLERENRDKQRVIDALLEYIGELP